MVSDVRCELSQWHSYSLSVGDGFREVVGDDIQDVLVRYDSQGGRRRYKYLDKQGIEEFVVGLA
jgi:hypothetical protein